MPEHFQTEDADGNSTFHGPVPQPTAAVPWEGGGYPDGGVIDTQAAGGGPANAPADLNEYTKEELKSYADQLGVEYASRDTKDDLVAAIQAEEQRRASGGTAAPVAGGAATDPGATPAQ